MKFTILIQILFDLLAKRKLSARYFAHKYSISERTVYRYIDCLALSVPIYVKRGRNGGICLSENYTLPIGFMTKEEYETAIHALALAYAHSPEQRFLHVKHKLAEQSRTERRDMSLACAVQTFLTDGGAFACTRTLFEKLRLVRECVQERAILEIEYVMQNQEKVAYKIEPHLLIFKQNIWYVYALSRTERRFRTLSLGRILSAVKTADRFPSRPLHREEMGLDFYTQANKEKSIRLRILPHALKSMQDLLGAENIHTWNGEWFADCTFPDDERLLPTLLSLSDSTRVVAPDDVVQRLQGLLDDVKRSYEG